MNAPSKVVPASPVARSAETRVAQFDWGTLVGDLNGYGCAVLEKLLSPDECRQIGGLYPEDEHFRSHIHVARHGFGKGEYRYFKYPLPDLIGSLRTALYPHLAAIANDWNARMASNRVTRAGMPNFSSNVTMQVRRVRRRCCSNMCLAISIACIRTSTATSRFRFRSRSCFPSRDGTGLRRWRIHSHGAAPAHAEPRRGRNTTPRRCSRFRRP